MGENLATRRLLVYLALTVVLAGCAAGATVAPSSTTSASVSQVPTPPASPSATPTPQASPAGSPAVTSYGVPFESSDPAMVPGVLDVYSPASAGRWPIVVMFHGAGGARGDLSMQAARVAERGYVVFVPDWGDTAPGTTFDLTSRRGMTAGDAQDACAVAFAESHAADYGGDPSMVIVFGHSAGAMAGANLTFAPEKPATGCLAGHLRPVDALVTWEGDWLFSDSLWNHVFAADPTLINAVAIWPKLPLRKNLKVALLMGETSDLPDLPVADLVARDPTGALQRQLFMNGALADGNITIAESQRLLFSALKAQGNPVTLEVMPSTTHEQIDGEGWSVFLAAFDRVAGR
ncbi:MAG: dienelactone hydrolase family protein [Candidatus Limnocylindrales bacterium]